MRRPAFTWIAAVLALGLWAPGAEAAWKTLTSQEAALRFGLDVGTRLERNQGSYYLVSGEKTLTFDVSDVDRIRLEARPIFPEHEVAPWFRASFTFNEGTERRFKRHSDVETMAEIEDAAAQNAARLPSTFLVGERDQLEIEVPDGASRVVVRLREAPLSRVFLRLAAWKDNANFDFDERKGRRRFRVEADLGRLGFDSNPYRTAKSQTGPGSANFWPAELMADARLQTSSQLVLRAGYDFKGRFYRDNLLNEQRHSVTLRQDWRPSGERSGFRLRLDQRLRLRSTTFYARGEQEEFDTVTDSGALVDLGDRFNYLEGRLQGKASISLSRSFSLEAALRYRNRDYREDYAQHPDIDALDYAALEAGLMLEWQPRRRWKLHVATDVSDRNYRQKFARDEFAIEVVEQAHAERRASVEVGASYRVHRGLRVRTTVERFLNSDRFEGYWNYDGYAGTLDAGYVFRSGHRVAVGARHRSWSYDRARVDFDATQPLRQKEQTSWYMEARYRLRPWIDATLEYRAHDFANNDADYAYQRSTWIVGFQLRR